MITDIDQLDLTKSYTYADYLTWQFDEMVEIIKGKIYKMSHATANKHQSISSHLHTELGMFLKKQNCQLRSAPFDARLSHTPKNQQVTTIDNPDICVICDPEKLEERGCIGASDFNIEILSPISSLKDKHENFNIYKKSSIKGCWIVDAANNLVDVFVLQKKIVY
jgi:Uma2 family endonuclease